MIANCPERSIRLEVTEAFEKTLCLNFFPHNFYLSKSFLIQFSKHVFDDLQTGTIIFDFLSLVQFLIKLVSSHVLDDSIKWLHVFHKQG